MAELTSTEVQNALYSVIDPELGINVVDLGLVYGIHTETDAATGASNVVLDMTLTTPMCPLSDIIEQQASAVLGEQYNAPVKVNWVWSPAWDLSKVTAAGREQLVALGFQGLQHEPPAECDAEEIVETVA